MSRRLLRRALRRAARHLRAGAAGAALLPGGAPAAAALALLVALAALATPAAAQVTPPGGRRPTAPPATRPTDRKAVPADSAGRQLGDSLPARELVEWAETDSVMQALLARQGYSATRYQGDQVTFDASNRVLTLRSDSGAAPAAVGRDQAIVVGHVVVYNDSTQVLSAIGDPTRGDTVVLRDPSQGADVVARGAIQYDIASKRASVSNISTEVTSGETWRVGGDRAVYTSQIDSATGEDERAFYVLDGTITSCDDPVPDYHFEAKEIKLISKKIMVARPAVLYIADVPVMIIPFLFQDLRAGRRSGMLTPRFGVNELFRNSPSYRRHFDNLGYYFALNDYTDAQMWLDWRSGEGANRDFGLADPGWTRMNGEWRYRWLNRFVTGRLSSGYLRQRDGQTNTTVSWAHQQDFSQTSRLSANLNYASSTILQRQNAFNPLAVLATIGSQLNYSRNLGPFSVQTGGTRTQYAGRPQIEQTLPRLTISSPPISLGSWLVWTPNFDFSRQQTLNIDQLGTFGFRYFTRAGGVLDSTRVDADRNDTRINFSTPLKIFGFQWNNSFSFGDRDDSSPGPPRAFEVPVLGPDGRPLRATNGRDSVVLSSRAYGKIVETTADWNTSINLPSLFQGTWRITPTVGIMNATGGPFAVRSTFSGGRWVQQTKRLQYGVSASPTFFGLFPGFGPVSRFRHAISPTVNYSYAPKADVSDEYLVAVGASRRGALSGLTQNSITVGLNTNLEAKLRSAADTASQPGGGTKVKVVSLNFDAVTYNFARLAELKQRLRDPVRFPDAAPVSNWAGLETQNVGVTLTSDLLPGFTVNTRYSLLQGNAQSDTAVFKPFRESVSANFSFNQSSGIFAAMSRIFGRAVEQKSPGTPAVEQNEQTPQDALAQQVLSQPVAGSAARDAQFAVPTGGGWQGSFSFSDSRQRPVTGTNVIEIDPAARCAPLLPVDPLQYQLCLATPTAGFQGVDPNVNQIGFNAPIYRTAPLTTLGSNISFNITPKWSAAWGTQYDFRAKNFASQLVTVQRELHDWRAIFAFTKGPNGNFAFNFFIALNAQPELKLNFDRRSYRDRTLAQ